MRKGKAVKTKYCSDEQLTQLIDAPSTPCAALCGVPLSPLNLISGDTVHEDCRCLYRDCREPLLKLLPWRRQICDRCWDDSKHDVSKVELRESV
jgi:hypothetical protein